MAIYEHDNNYTMPVLAFRLKHCLRTSLVLRSGEISPVEMSATRVKKFDQWKCLWLFPSKAQLPSCHSYTSLKAYLMKCVEPLTIVGQIDWYLDQLIKECWELDIISSLPTYHDYPDPSQVQRGSGVLTNISCQMGQGRSQIWDRQSECWRLICTI